MTTINVHKAKSQLSKLIELAKKGEDVVIAKNGKPEVRLVAFEEPAKDWFGMDAGNAWIADDFDELPVDIFEMMTDPKIFPDENDK